MKTLTDHLAQYAANHRNKRNIVTHFIGIPLIVIAVAILLSKPSLTIYGLPLSPATLTLCIATVFYLQLDARLGVSMFIFLIFCLWLGSLCAQLPTRQWLTWGLSCFILGWVMQFIGHMYEGRKPAFVDDTMGLAIGPLFVMAELAFACGLRQSLKDDIEQRLNPNISP